MQADLDLHYPQNTILHMDPLCLIVDLLNFLLTETTEKKQAVIVEQDQTARKCTLILIYALRKVKMIDMDPLCLIVVKVFFLTETTEKLVESVEQDQTAHICRLILIYPLRKIHGSERQIYGLNVCHSVKR